MLGDTRFNKEDSNVAHACRKNDSAESEQFCKLCLYTGGGNLVYDASDAIISFVVENAGEMHFDCLIAQVHDELSSKCDLRLTHAVLVPGGPSRERINSLCKAHAAHPCARRRR